MTTASKLSGRRYRRHELMFDRDDRGHAGSCACGWRGLHLLDETDAHYTGAKHLALMALAGLRARRSLRTLATGPAGRIFPDGDAALWAELRRHRNQLTGEAQAVLDVADEQWPEKTR